MKTGRMLASFVTLLVVSTFQAGPAAAQSTAPSGTPRKADPWQPVRPLVGTWEGEASGQPGTGKSEREYRFTLKDRYINITAKTTYPPG
jgi:hypothetical protein